MIRLTVLIALLALQFAAAQDFQGVATYSSDRKLEIQLDSTKMNSDMQNQIMEMMRKQFQKEYTLRFNKSESVYKEEQSLESPSAVSGMQVIVAGSGASDVLYKNSKEERFVAQRDMFGKAFLVKDTLTKLNWKLVNETKKIGNYTCYKATTTRTVETSSSFSFDEEEEKEGDVKKEEITTVAWYTPEIPVSNGPSTYWGLPGLIMEVSDGDVRILCNKIVLNPKKKVIIKAPDKGKVVTETKFGEIMQKKAKEMSDRMAPRRGDGNSFEIRVRG